MPLLKGIKVNLISQWECKVHPEFPHPEGKHESSHSGFHHIDVDETMEVSDNALALTNQITASVYIPSCSGARFWIRWSITDPTVEESPWYFFKLLMNGRQVTSWGTNAYEKPDGHVMRGLFEPSDRWNYKNEGTVYKNMGTEARPFLFAEEGFGRSVAIDGGLIEVQVFRAFGRKRRLAEPTDFRSQEPYGILMPSGGLLERPQDAKFYDWHLKDPKDSPFVRFKFHYRSWDSLQASELIPENHRRALLSPTPSVMKTLGLSEQLGFEWDVNDLNDGEDGSAEDESDRDEYDRDDPGEDDSGGEADDEQNWEELSEVDEEEAPWVTNGVDIANSQIAEIVSQNHRIAAGLQYDTAPIHPDPFKSDSSAIRLVNATSDSPEVQKKGFSGKRKALTERPLPEIPQRSSSTRTNLSRTSSTSSFITPSLRSYVEKSRPSSAEARIQVARAVAVVHGVKAKVVHIPVRRSQTKIPAAESTPPDTSFEKSVLPMATKNSLTVPSDFTPPMRTSSATHHPKPLNDNSPLSDFFSQPNIANITMRKHKRSPGLLARLSISGSSFRSGSPFKSIHSKENSQPENDASLTSKSPISEGEWMCRTPSPVKNTDDTRYENMWSPSPGGDGKKKHVESGATFSGNPAPNANGGMLYKMKKGVGNGFKGMLSGSPASSITGKKTRPEDERESKRSFTDNPISSSDGGDNGDKRLSDKERLRRKGMEWVDHVKNYRSASSAMHEPKVRSGQLDFSADQGADPMEEPKWI